MFGRMLTFLSMFQQDSMIMLNDDSVPYDESICIYIYIFFFYVWYPYPPPPPSKDLCSFVGLFCGPLGKGGVPWSRVSKNQDFRGCCLFVLGFRDPLDILKLRAPGTKMSGSLASWPLVPRALGYKITSFNHICLTQGPHEPRTKSQDFREFGFLGLFVTKTSNRFNGFYLCFWFRSLFSSIWIRGQFLQIHYHFLIFCCLISFAHAPTI